jgi:tetratricopeptide (TPR) repeat protein
MAGDRVVDHSELLAHHTTEAISLGEAAGDGGNGDLKLRAARYLVLAGDRAIQLDASAARTRYEQALELLPTGSEEHGLTLLKLAETAQVFGRFEEANEHAAAAAAELEAAGAARSAAIAYGLLANTYFQLGGSDRMRAALERSLELLEPLPPGPELVESYGRMIALESMSGESPEKGLEWAEKAVSLGEELGLRRELVRAYMWRGLMRCELGDLAGIDDLERALADTIELRMALSIPAYVNLADQVWRQRGPAAALEIQREAIDRSLSRGGNPTWPKGESCWMLYDLGEWDELLRVAEELRLSEEERGGGQPGAMAHGYAAAVLVRRRRLEEGGAMVESVHERSRQIEHPQVLAPALVAAALFEQARGDLARAVGYVEEYRHVTRNRPFFRAQNLTDAVRIACAGNDIALAEGLLDNLVTAAERDRLSELTARATIAAARGDDERPLFAEAAEGWEQLGCVFEHAIALDAIGEDEAAGEIFAQLGIPRADQTAARTAK